MKIHGTAKGGALSTKDFGVAFGGAAGTPELITDGSTDWTAKFILQGNSVGGSGGGVWGGVTANAETSESIWNSNALGVEVSHNGGGWTGQFGYSYGGRTTPSGAGWIFENGTTNPYYFLLEQSGTSVTAKAYSDTWGGTQVGSTITMSSFVEMTGLSYAFFGDNRTSLHTFNGNGDTFSVVQSGSVNWSNDFSDASDWEIPLAQPTVNDAVSGQGNILYTSGDSNTQYWARTELTA